MKASKKIKKKLVRLAGARQDMEYALHAADLFLSIDNPDLRYHLFTSFVLSYGRPFSENSGVGRLQCDYPEYENHPDEAIKVRHNRLMDARNQFIAHSSIRSMKLEVVPPGVPSPLSGRILLQPEMTFAKRIFLSADNVKWLAYAAVALSAQLDRDIDAILKQFYSTGDKVIELVSGVDAFAC